MGTFLNTPVKVGITCLSKAFFVHLQVGFTEFRFLANLLHSERGAVLLYFLALRTRGRF